MTLPYKGDVTPEECWSVLRSDPRAVLIDVRTSAEWNFVGLPVLPDGTSLPVLVEWQSYPDMTADAAGFAARAAQGVQAAGGSQDAPVFHLCRSGARSMASAAAMTQNGFTQCFNIVGGFEGPPDEAGHRVARAGWKAAGLPWRQT